MKRKELFLEDYLSGIKNKDMSVLARAITLVESRNLDHQKIAGELIKEVLKLKSRSKRIGISGTPGVGKSTFLENFGMYLINNGFKVAVLAVDPSSQLTGGSILGDKTRMAKLSSHRDGFVRPSPNGPTLGGIAAKTREAILLCEAFGFDYIFVETVGVGQSEISVSHIVDMFVLLMQPGSGDELQGIKRGILEVSDLVIVNKADGEFEKTSKIAEHDYRRSLEILQEKRDWKTTVLRCSSLHQKGFDEVLETLKLYFDQYNFSHRDDQFGIWIEELLKEKFAQNLSASESYPDFLKQMKDGKLDILTGIEKIYKGITD